MLSVRYVAFRNLFSLAGGFKPYPLVARSIFGHFKANSFLRILPFLCAASSQLLAEEGGSGHYLPGSMASFMDSVPLTETFLVRYNLVNYEGSVGANRAIPIAGQAAIDADVSSWGHGLTILWRPPLDLGEKWSYALSATIPVMLLDVTAQVAVAPGGPAFNRDDDVSALGDVVLMPLMFNYHVNDDINWNYRLAIYAPTGSYEEGELANTSKNFWTFEPTAAFMYFGKKNGRELSIFLGADFNTENPDTDYKSGTQAHIEFTAAQHFPIKGGLGGVGLTGFWYEQITGDSGSGATFGDFKARDVGIGPVVSYITKVDGHDLLAELKWLHETETKKRLEGDTVFLKVIFKFY